MFVALPGLIGSGSAPTPPPPYGTLLASQCSGNIAYNGGPTTYTDAQGTPWYDGMYTLWEQLADGSGGYFWSSPGNNSSDAYSACWYPYGYCISANSGDNYVSWEGCGSSGNFGPWSYYYNNDYSDGSGGSYNSSGGGSYQPPYSGDIIYQSGVDNCCTVYYDGAGGYYINDSCGGGGCPDPGEWLSDGCNSTSGYDASDSYFDGAWAYGSFYADGSCGQYFVEAGTNMNGCYYPNGWKFDYTSNSYSLHWTVSDGTSTTVSEGDVTYASGWSSSNIADGSGGTYSDGGGWSLNYGDLIASGTYYDGYYGQDFYYEVYYDGMGGYWVSQYPI